mgnify:CR=1 FL=1|jgi:hypothetical protein
MIGSPNSRLRSILNDLCREPTQNEGRFEMIFNLLIIIIVAHYIIIQEKIFNP